MVLFARGELGEGSTERGSEGGLDSLSQGGNNRKSRFVVVRLSEVGLIGKKGTKVPNASIAEISLEHCIQLKWVPTAAAGTVNDACNGCCLEDG